MDSRYALDDAAWLWHPDLKRDAIGFALFRLDFVSDGLPLTLQVSGDMRFELALNGEMLGRGPDSSDPVHWSFSTFQLHLSAGSHRLEALVWWLPPDQNLAGRMSWQGGFAIAAVDRPLEDFHSGFAPWKVATMDGWKPAGWLTWAYHAIGPSSSVDLRVFDSEMAKWCEPVRVREPVNGNPHGLKADGWCLLPSALPELRSDLWRGGTVRFSQPIWIGDDAVFSEDTRLNGDAWTALWQDGIALTLPPGGEASVLMDFDDYLTGYPLIEFEGGEGTELNWQWSEALYLNEQDKGNRDEIDGKHFRGFGDTFVFGGGGRRFIRSHWWRAGRYVLLRLRVKSEALILHQLAIERTGYPLEFFGKFQSSESSLDPVLDLCRRGLRSAMSDVFMDSPYFEQMMYMGDTRLAMLMTYVSSRDDRLPRRAVDVISFSRDSFGLTAERYPSHQRQESATFSMFWIWMLHDHTYWRNDPAWVASHLPTARGILDTLAAFKNSEGLLERAPGWNFVDWVPAWKQGWPPSARTGVSAIVNLQYLLTLQKAAELEDALGNPRLALTHREHALRLGDSIRQAFWDDSRGLFADDNTRQFWSQHAQIFGLLSGLMPVESVASWADPAASFPDMAQATIYFQHYLFEAMHRLGRGDWLLNRLVFWNELVEMGLKCPVEQPEPSRSDCHVWGSHPMLHVHTSLAGISPAAPGFAKVRIAPQLGTLRWLESEIPHPRGSLRFRAEISSGILVAEIDLPPDTSGILIWHGEQRTLQPGCQKLSVGTPG